MKEKKKSYPLVSRGVQEKDEEEEEETKREKQEKREGGRR